MSDWLVEVGELTLAHRELRARQFEDGARRKRAQCRLGGANEQQVHEDTRWYRARAQGQRTKIESVQECGIEQLRISCQACGLSHDRAGRCGNSLLCLKCRGARAAAKRREFLRARDVVIESAQARGLLERSRPRGRFSEKLLSLTGPHLASDTIASRIERILRAWPLFRKELKRYLNGKDVRTFEWFRVFEWTPASDQLGHPHLHVWMFSPFIEPVYAQELWRMALIKAGCPADACPKVIIDLREFKHRDGRGAQELIKYLTKDIDANGAKIPPQSYAEVYKTLDGCRVTQGSLGFMKLADREAHQCECGASLPFRVRKVKAVGDGLADEKGNEP